MLPLHYASSRKDSHWVPRKNHYLMDRSDLGRIDPPHYTSSHMYSHYVPIRDSYSTDRFDLGRIDPLHMDSHWDTIRDLTDPSDLSRFEPPYEWTRTLRFLRVFNRDNEKFGVASFQRGSIPHVRVTPRSLFSDTGGESEGGGGGGGGGGVFPRSKRSVRSGRSNRSAGGTGGVFGDRKYFPINFPLLFSCFPPIGRGRL